MAELNELKTTADVREAVRARYVAAAIIRARKPAAGGLDSA
jgi:hypothetical protein